MLHRACRNEGKGRDRVKSAFAETLEMIEGQSGLSLEELARIAGTSSRSAYRWAAGKTDPRSHARDRVLQVAVVVRELSDTLTRDGAHIWLFSPNPFLDYERPVDVLKRGDFRSVLGAIAGLKDGVFI